MRSLDQFLLFIVLPFVLLVSLLEAVVLSQIKQAEPYDWRAAGVSFLDFILRVGMQIVLPLSIATPVINWAVAHRQGEIAMDATWAFALLFIGQEFCYYWFHRAAHRVRWFWCNHAVHHSSNQLNLAAALRIGIFGRLSGTQVFFIPMIFIGFDALLVFDVLTLNLLYQFWVHATWIPKLGPLEWVLNTPSAHRVHHASNLEYLDANYGGVLIVFDRLFGTYRAEDAAIACRYGLTEPILSYNPIKIELTQWGLLAKDLFKARSLRAVVGYLFKPPGWQPSGEQFTTEAAREKARLKVHTKARTKAA